MRLNFMVNYRTEYGECLALVGETPAIGQWKDFRPGMMRWTAGDWWQVELTIDARLPFMYKYVVVDHSTMQAKRWEQGMNRICDPEYLGSTA